MTFSRKVKRLFTTKPISAFEADEAIGTDHLERNMSLVDLLCIGVGGTLGTGIFVLSGLVANEYAGPAVVISYLIAGLVCLCSAASYAELSTRVPAEGSTYAFSLFALGEYPAVVAAWALSLEYGVSASAVARSWGSKVALYISDWGVPITEPSDDIPSASNMYGINYFAGVIAFACVALLLIGTNAGKYTVNFITLLKILLVLFMMITGFTQYQSSNMTPFAPYAIKGILAGSTQCFFAYIGFDEGMYHYYIYLYYICLL